MIRHLHLFLLAILLLAFQLQAQAEPTDSPEASDSVLELEEEAPGLALTACALPDGTSPEATLPRGAWLHVRLNKPSETLKDLEGLAIKVAPNKALPPEIQTLLTQPNPLMSFIGMQTGDPAMNIKALSKMTGLNLEGCATLSIYPGDPASSFILSLPVDNLPALSSMMGAILEPQEQVQVGGGTWKGLKIRPGSGDLPSSLILMCSTSKLYVCGSEKLADSLATITEAKSLANDPILPKGVRPHDAADLVAGLSADPFRPFVAMFRKNHASMPSQWMEMLRSQVATMPKAQRMRLEARLRFQFGVNGIDELVGHLECWLEPTWKLLADKLFQEADRFHGLVFAMDMGEKFQKISASLVTDAASPDTCGKPLSLAVLRDAVAQLPASRTFIRAKGRTLETDQNAWVNSWIDAVEAQYRTRTFSTDMAVVRKYLTSLREPPALEGLCDTVIQSAIPLGKGLDLSSYASLSDLVGDLHNEDLIQTYAQVTLIPQPQGPAFLQRLKDIEKCFNEGQKAAEELQISKHQPPSFIKGSCRVSTATTGDLTRHTLEYSYVTRTGFFGHHQHELINRSMYGTRTLGAFLAVEELTQGKSWLSGTIKGEPVDAALETLLAQVPEGTHEVWAQCGSHLVLDIIETLTQVEELVHRDIDAYLADIEDLRQSSKDDEDFNEGLADLEMPLGVWRLNVDEAGELYCLTPGGLRYPRPMATDVLKELIAEYKLKDSQLGGTLCTGRALPGRYEWTLAHNTDATAYLIKTLVNKAFESYVAKPDGQQELMKKIMVPGDMDRAKADEEALLENQTWEFLNELR